MTKKCTAALLQSCQREDYPNVLADNPGLS